MKTVSDRWSRGERIDPHRPDNFTRRVVDADKGEIKLSARVARCVGRWESLFRDLCFCFFDVFVWNFGPAVGINRIPLAGEGDLESVFGVLLRIDHPRSGSLTANQRHPVETDIRKGLLHRRVLVAVGRDAGCRCPLRVLGR